MIRTISPKREKLIIKYNIKDENTLGVINHKINLEYP